MGHPLVPGTAAGMVLTSSEPISFWGGYDHRTGEITDRRHPLSGRIAAGHILAVPFSRGSSTTTAVLLEAIRSGTAPAAILTTSEDTFFALASIVAQEMYGKYVPIVVISAADFSQLRSGDWLQLEPDGTLLVEERADGEAVPGSGSAV
ncbi:MAG: aconitase X swivel domain-containing protein [Candidatus Promineifilaceae bacterium]